MYYLVNTVLGSILNTKYLKYYFKCFPYICILNTFRPIEVFSICTYNTFY